jgi:ClpP class serine protease
MSNPSLAGEATMISDADMNGFMACVHGMDRSLGLDLILHTPGGVVSAAQAIVSYLRDAFSGDIRVLVPQLAMSAGTMLACAARTIVMGRHSSIGPFDPFLSGCSTFAVLREFNEARDDVKRSPNLAAFWRPILEKYPPGFIIDCRNAIELAHELVSQWLQTGMFREDSDADQRAQRVIALLGDGDAMKQHDRHVSAEEAERIGLKVQRLEADPELQDRLLTAHHAALYSMSRRGMAKLIESSGGVAFNTAQVPLLA